MDIWAWVEALHTELTEAGHGQTADMLYSLPDLVCDSKTSQAQALFPEALAAARSLKNPWMEVFFRHWEMRLRLGNLAQGEAALPEAVSLLEFAHREECRDCPQTICVTQDIASCYAYVDGPGWVEERKAVCKETLERINPKWNCFMCLTAEYADALKDGGALQEAVEYLDKTTEELLRAGKEYRLDRRLQRAQLQLEMGQAQEALNALDEIEKLNIEVDDDMDRLDAILARTLALAKLGRFGEAWELLPDWGQSVPPSRYDYWLKAAYLIMMASPEKNNWQMGALFKEGLAYMHSVGSHRLVIELGRMHCELALKRSAVSTAERGLAIMREHLPKLRATLGADNAISNLEELAGKTERPALPVPAAQLLEHLAAIEDRDPEYELELLLKALKDNPDNAEIALQASHALSAVGENAESWKLLRSFAETYPKLSESIVPTLIGETPDEESDYLEELAALMDGNIPFLGNWCRAQLAYRRQDWGKVGEYIEKFLQDKPKAIGARKLWATAAMSGKDFAVAVRLRREIADLIKEEGEDPHNYLWDVLVAASAAQDWRTVRETCIEMNFDMEPGDEPIESPGSWIRIRYYENGKWVDNMAVRTGPATARIIAVAHPSDVQHVRDWVVFDPSPLEEWPEDEEEKENFAMPYYLEHTLETAGYTAYMLDGVDPGEKWEGFYDALTEAGYAVWVRSSDSYRVADPARDDDDYDEEGGEPWGLPGLYVALGVPPRVSAAETDALLSRLTKGWEHPLSWVELARAAGADVKKHQDIVDRYGL